MRLQEDKQIVATLENVSAIMANYAIVPASFEMAASGIENCTILVDDAHEQYVLRVYRQHKKSNEEILQELEFVNYLHDNGIKTAPPILNKTGSLLTEYNDGERSWQAFLMHRATGTHAEGYSRELLKEMAHTQARMHLLAAVYQDKHAGSNAPTELGKYDSIISLDPKTISDKKVRGIVNRAQNYLLKWHEDLPIGLCHMDFDNGNILTDENNKITAVLDFDDLSLVPFVVCLAYTLWDVASEGNEASVNYYLEEYQSVRPLSTDEKKYIKPAMLLRNYVIACVCIGLGQMDLKLLNELLAIESQLLRQRI